MAIDDEKAATQYGDLKGTVSIDGFDGSFLNALRSYSSMPSGFAPVGIGLSLFARLPKRSNGDSVQFVLYGADVNVVGSGPDEWRRHVIQNGDIAVFEFELKIPFASAVELMKRVSIKVWHKSLDEPRVRVLEDG